MPLRFPTFGLAHMVMAVALLLVSLAVQAAQAATPAVSLAASSTKITFGESLTLSGSIDPAAAGETVPMGIFQAKGKVLLFDGWRRLAGEDATEETKKKGKKDADEPDEDESDGELPLLNPGDALNLLDVAALKRSTKPPPRFTQASLIKKLEAEGIGRPSTYAAIMRVILERGYVQEEKRKLHATPLGLGVTDFLVRHYSGNFIALDYTARLEEDLDRIARGDGAQRRSGRAAGAVPMADRGTKRAP